jgi:hypothetical protein
VSGPGRCTLRSRCTSTSNDWALLGTAASLRPSG